MGFVTTKDNVKLFDLSMGIANAGMRAIAYDRRGFGRSDRLLQPRGRGRHPQLSAD